MRTEHAKTLLLLLALATITFLVAALLALSHAHRRAQTALVTIGELACRGGAEQQAFAAQLRCAVPGPGDDVRELLAREAEALAALFADFEAIARIGLGRAEPEPTLADPLPPAPMCELVAPGGTRAGEAGDRREGGAA